MLFPTAPSVKKGFENPHALFHTLTSKERLKHVSSLEEIIGDHSKALDMERSIIAFAQGDIVLYRKKMRQILYNLSINFDHIVSTYHIWEIAFIDSKLLFEGTKGWNELQKRKRQIEEVLDFTDEIDAMIDAKAESDNHTAVSETKCRNKRCRKQHSKPKIIKYRRQTRSGDEGATAFYECMHCHKRWRG